MFELIINTFKDVSNGPLSTAAKIAILVGAFYAHNIDSDVGGIKENVSTLQMSVQYDHQAVMNLETTINNLLLAYDQPPQRINHGHPPKD